MWYTIDDETARERRAIDAADAARRADNIEHVKRDVQLRIERKRGAYDVHDLVARAKQADALMEEHRLNDEISSKMALAALYHNVVEADKKYERKMEKREEKLARAVDAETKRLLRGLKKAEALKKKTAWATGGGF